MKKKILYISFILLTSLSLVEIVLRFQGCVPGYMKNYSGFSTQENFEIYNLYVTDEKGIYKFNPELLDSYKNKVDSSLFDSLPNIYQENINSIFKSFKLLQEEIAHPDSAKDSIAKLFTIALQTEDSNYLQLVSTYLNDPFNEDGFRSIPFKKVSSSKKKVLLLGDSFAFGMSADPIYYSFYDILLAKGYIVYNTGINGTDPAQYAAIAKKYIPLLEPDLVIANFSCASDYMLFKRTPKANEPHEHFTSAGFIESNPLGQYLGPAEAYNYYLSLIQVPTSNIFSKFFSKSVALSYLYGFLVHINIFQHAISENYNSYRENTSIEEQAEISKGYFQEIKKIAEANDVKLINLAIPNKGDLEPGLINKSIDIVNYNALNIVFGKGNYFVPLHLNIKDYEERGDHFSNSGASRYASFLDSLIYESN